MRWLPLFCWVGKGEAGEPGTGGDASAAGDTVGFPRKLAAQLVGAFEEIQGNVYDHSGAPGSGLAAYRATARQFEFVVSDGGHGVLEAFKAVPTTRTWRITPRHSG